MAYRQQALSTSGSDWIFCVKKQCTKGRIGTEIVSQSSVTYLGLTLEQSLMCESVADKILAKCASGFKFLYHRSGLVLPVILSHFDEACSACFCRLSVELKNKLQVMQNNVIWYFCLIVCHYSCFCVFVSYVLTMRTMLEVSVITLTCYPLDYVFCLLIQMKSVKINSYSRTAAPLCLSLCGTSQSCLSPTDTFLHNMYPVLVHWCAICIAQYQPEHNSV